MKKALRAVLLTLVLQPPVLAQPPKLTVLMVIDQLSEPGLQAQEKHLRGGGLAELLRSGVRYRQAFYRHGATATGPGHALLGSGQYGSVSGIVGNDWYDAKQGREVYCAEDPSVVPSTPNARPMSPVQFQGTSLAQRVKKKYPKARVVGVSLKDRSAILTPGAGADAAYWYDDKVRQFVSSSYYRFDAGLLAAFNGRLDGFLAEHPVWEYGLSASTETVCPADKAQYHAPRLGLGDSFPHPLRERNALGITPFGNDLLEQFAEAAVVGHGLGAGPAADPDVLVLSFSAYDYVGHAFGPDSCEIADATARLDDTVGRFLKFLEARVPKDRLAVLLSADHGSASVPELLADQGVDAGRVDLYSPRAKSPALADLPPLRRQIEEAAAAALGHAPPQAAPFLIADFQEPCLYLDPAGPGKGKESQARYWLKGYLGVQGGVQSVHIREDLEAKQAPEALLLPWRADRGGDVCMILKPHWIWGSGHAGTTHGQPHDYDAHVPLIVRAPGVPAAEVTDRVSIAQVSPTIARLLGLSLHDYPEPQPLPALFKEKKKGKKTP